MTTIGPRSMDALRCIVSWPGEMTETGICDELNVKRARSCQIIRELRLLGMVRGGLVPSVKFRSGAEDRVSISARLVLTIIRRRWWEGIDTARGDVAELAGQDWTPNYVTQLVGDLRRVGLVMPHGALWPTDIGRETVRAAHAAKVTA